MPCEQARYWIATIPANTFWVPRLDAKCIYLKGQLEEGETGYLHWQVLLAFKSKVTKRGCQAYVGINIHVEPTRSEAAEAYVWKEETRVPGTQFEMGQKGMKRNVPDDWDKIWNDAKAGKIEEIPADVRIRCYNQLKRI